MVICVGPVSSLASTVVAIVTRFCALILSPGEQ